MKLETTLITSFILLFSNTIYSYNINNSCENKLNNNLINEAILEAKKIENKYDSNFCLGKALYRSSDFLNAAKAFATSEPLAELPVDQMFSMLYQGISLRDNGSYQDAIKVFTKGFDTAKLGNTKYMQMEQRFLNQSGQTYLILNDSQNALDSFTKAARLSANDDERASNFEGLAKSYAIDNQYDSAIEFSVKASNTYQRIGDLGKYADMEINKAKYYFKAGNTELSLTTLESLESFAKKNGGTYYEAKALIEQGFIYNQLGDIDSASAKSKQGIALAKQIGANDLITN
jgi:tetratricopeptide (TPR) repeat protein